MGSDSVYYYDFNAETRLDNWTILEQQHGAAQLRTTVTLPEDGQFVIVTPCYRHLTGPSGPRLEQLSVNGLTHDWNQEMKTAYVGCGCARQGLRIPLQKGKNELRMTMTRVSENPLRSLDLRLIPDLTRPDRYAHEYTRTCQVTRQEITRDQSQDNEEGWIPGCGASISPGRFGFSKGDGVLDCAMPCLGVVDKMYLCGNPRYHKPFRWSYSLLPPNAELHGSYPPATCGIEQDHITINHLSVTWEATIQGKHFSCTYSLASPGIITETNAETMRISDLEFAGNYQYVMMPAEKDHVHIRSLDQIPTKPRITENWMLFFGSTEFPDLPLMVTLDRQPDKLEVRRHPQTGRLTEIIFHGCQRLITATPFGMESLDPIQPDQDDILNDAIQRCRLWSRAFMAYPVRCKEYFRLDEKAKKVKIRQDFEYRYLTDEWQTQPLELAPLPPVLTLSGTKQHNQNYRDLNFPTKFGYLWATVGRTSRYDLDFMPVEHQFPLRDKTTGPDITRLLQAGLQEYFDFQEQFPQTLCPHSYAGATMEPYALITTMMNFLTENDQKKLRKLVADRLAKACDDQGTYTYGVINYGHVMTMNPNDEQIADLCLNPQLRMQKLCNWYQRTEPFTGIHFHICYLNLCFISEGIVKTGTPEEIASLKIPMIENDWGIGLTFYYLYLCSLATGDLKPIRDNWKKLTEVFDFFWHMHDWACMGTGYSDNAILWVEGGNYGAFTAYVQLAEALGDAQAQKHGIYLAAKQLVLRQAVCRSAQNYFHKIFNVEPWYITKFFHEEANPACQFQNVPKDLLPGRCRNDGVYNLTTEGIFPETFRALLDTCPKDFREALKRVRQAVLYAPRDCQIPDGTPWKSMAEAATAWHSLQQTTSLLISEALDETIPPKQCLDDLAQAEQKGLVIKRWRGIHIFSRRLPENYFKAQILAWLTMKQHPIWLEYWENMTVTAAEWAPPKAVITFKNNRKPMRVKCGIRQKPECIRLNGKNITVTYQQDSHLLITPEEDGTLEITFTRQQPQKGS